MRSPAEMQIIQIELTDACESRCGGCTRLVPHVAKPFYITVPQFEKAVHSMHGWNGMVLGAMGGNPVLHPQFEEITRAFVANWGKPIDPELRLGRAPILDFNAYVLERLSDPSSGRGLWTSLGNAFYRHLEIIHDSYSYWCVNDHYNDGRHQALLITREEFCKTYGITDDQWLENRDKCWVQETWSASINPHGAYFCEVAAAIDNLYFGGQSAWPVEQGWWRRTPKDFESQLHLCNHCALAQPGPSIQANRDIDVISPLHFDKLRRQASPAVSRGRVVFVGEVTNETHAESIAAIDEDTPLEDDTFVVLDERIDRYMPTPNDRVSPENDSVRPRKVTAITVCVGREEHLAKTLAHNAAQVDELFVILGPGGIRKLAPLTSMPRGNISYITSEAYKDGDSAFNKGSMINVGLRRISNPDWVLLIDCDVLIPHRFRDFTRNFSINPGVLYGVPRIDLFTPADVNAVLDGRTAGYQVSDFEDLNGFFQLFNRRAVAIRDRWPAAMSEEFCSAGGIDSWFMQQFPRHKRVLIRDLPCYHIAHAENDGEGWNGPGNLSGSVWRQCGMIHHKYGWISLGSLPDEYELRLVDTVHAKATVLRARRGEVISPDVVRVNTQGDGLVYLGEDIGPHHVHVSYKPLDGKTA